LYASNSGAAAEPPTAMETGPTTLFVNRKAGAALQNGASANTAVDKAKEKRNSKVPPA
jgi:hypothetical protein